MEPQTSRTADQRFWRQRDHLKTHMWSESSPWEGTSCCQGPLVHPSGAPGQGKHEQPRLGSALALGLLADGG